MDLVRRHPSPSSSSESDPGWNSPAPISARGAQGGLHRSFRRPVRFQPYQRRRTQRGAILANTEDLESSEEEGKKVIDEQASKEEVKNDTAKEKVEKGTDVKESADEGATVKAFGDDICARQGEVKRARNDDD